MHGAGADHNAAKAATMIACCLRHPRPPRPPALIAALLDNSALHIISYYVLALLLFLLLIILFFSLAIQTLRSLGSIFKVVSAKNILRFVDIAVSNRVSLHRDSISARNTHISIDLSRF